MTPNQSIMVEKMKDHIIMQTFQKFLDDVNACEEYLYIFINECWKAFSVRPVYDDDYNIIKNNIQPVEIPEPETV